jgi:hypothetical protein
MVSLPRRTACMGCGAAGLAAVHTSIST